MEGMNAARMIVNLENALYSASIQSHCKVRNNSAEHKGATEDSFYIFAPFSMALIL